MDPRTQARALALARIGIGLGLLADPRLAVAVWLGPGVLRKAPARVLARALGARDLAIGLGTLISLGRGNAARPWLIAGVISDAADVAVTVLERDRLPSTAMPIVVATGGVGVAMGAYALAETDGGGTPSAGASA